MQLDRAFYELSADLVEAAKAADQARERVLLGKILEACVACHSKYANGRFPGLKAE
ncbi:hypothetical protein MELB17_11826 [Marinobacter sp. ELB17]|nr:hypothetical protein MELB17_11826 [Marinobacter sp. ELB17]